MSSTTLTVLTLLSLFISSSNAISTNTTYQISPSSFPSLCLAPSGTTEGVPLIVTSCNSSDSVFTFDGSHLQNTETDMCIDITAGDTWSGNLAQLWGCYPENTNQAFAIDGDEIQWNNGQNICLDLTDGKGVDGNKVQIWTCSDQNDNQKWTFSQVEEVDGEEVCESDSTGDDSEDDLPECDDEDDSSSTADSEALTASSSATVATAVVTDAATATDPITATESLTATTDSVTATESVTAATESETASDSATATDSVTGSVTVTAATESTTASAADLIAANLAAYGSSSSSSKHHHKSSTGWSSASATASSSDDWSSASATASTSTEDWSSASSTASSSEDWSSASATDSTSGTATATASASTSTSTGTISSGYLQTSGTKVVDSSGNAVVLRGTNIGGWLVLEDWMCGITDSDNADRFSQVTLESRFGADQTANLLSAWQDNWFTSSDFDNIASMGFNMIRLPFSFRTLQDASGNWLSNRYDKLDWAIAQAKQRGIYVIPVFHIWDTQQSDYSLISENSDAGQASRDAAVKIWKEVAGHYVGEATIAAFDVINEPTGSYANNLQQDLYTAVRDVDANRIIVMESMNADPSQYGWTQVIYSMHEYLMMGSDTSSNEASFSGAQTDVSLWQGFNVPVYMGEFMASDDTLTYLLGQLSDSGIWWSGWTYKTVNMGRWGLYNLPSNQVDVSNDSYDSILAAWNGMSSMSLTKQDVVSIYESALGGTSQKRGLASESAKVGSRRDVGGHRGRSRRGGMVHGKSGSIF
ncbi:hypothetical protein P7C73_g3463, partial [Tremellales sp. Uapishka_1]